MVCESWKTKLDTWLDGEGPEEEMRQFSAHVRTCSSCSADALDRVRMKRAVQLAGRRFTASAEFRKQIQRNIATRPRWQPSLRLGWALASAAAFVLIVGMLLPGYLSTKANTNHVFSEIADLHVATLASSSPVDVLSTDRHTVKPWFQGKIPFAFNLPEVQNTEFSLLGGRMTYLEQTPGAQLIYDVRKHHISVFIFQERSLPVTIDKHPSHQSLFTTETWVQNGLRYFAIGDASPADLSNLVKLFQAVGS